MKFSPSAGLIERFFPQSDVGISLCELTSFDYVRRSQADNGPFLLIPSLQKMSRAKIRLYYNPSPRYELIKAPRRLCTDTVPSRVGFVS